MKPEHYQTETFDIIDISKTFKLNFNKGNIVKYICRAGKKEGESELKDLNKALDYLQREIEHYKTTKAYTHEIKNLKL